MTDGETSYRTPYTTTPGGSTAPPEMSPEEGRADLVTFAWLAVINTVIIGVAGVIAWWIVH